MIDVNMNFKNNRFTGTINTVDYRNAIKQKVRNILLLKRGDITYKDNVYTNLFYLLGNQMSSLTSNVMKEYIKNAFLLHIPEVELKDINIKKDYENQKYTIYLTYLIKDKLETVEQTLDLEVSN